MNRKRRIFFETQEVVQRTKRGYVDLEMDYFQFYSAAFSHVASLSSSCSKDFILWVMGKVNEDNSFIYSQQMFKEFNQDLAKIQKPKQYVESTMKMALRELSDAGIITRLSRGEYRVSPKLFWTDEVSERVKSIKEIEMETRELPEGATPKFKKYTDEELSNVSNWINPQTTVQNTEYGKE